MGKTHSRSPCRPYWEGERKKGYNNLGGEKKKSADTLPDKTVCQGKKKEGEKKREGPHFSYSAYRNKKKKKKKKKKKNA